MPFLIPGAKLTFTKRFVRIAQPQSEGLRSPRIGAVPQQAGTAHFLISKNGWFIGKSASGYSMLVQVHSPAVAKWCGCKLVGICFTSGSAKGNECPFGLRASPRSIRIAYRCRHSNIRRHGTAVDDPRKPHPGTVSDRTMLHGIELPSDTNLFHPPYPAKGSGGSVFPRSCQCNLKFGYAAFRQRNGKAVFFNLCFQGFHTYCLREGKSVMCVRSA